MTDGKDVNIARWDDSDSDIGVWSLVLNDDQILTLNTAERYYRGLSRKPKGDYVLSMCVWGTSHTRVLTATTLEAAKEECEKWLVENLKNRIKGLKQNIRFFNNLLKLLEGA